ncbi:MAG TPA: protoporphyrinogen oxidase [Vicinamibacteria bacterium]|nr:protoporphyrinogen oxidase [Vicinamibacteria bacterium]
MSAPSGMVAIVGGGIAGLSAAYELLSRGVPFVLLEAGERWGGVIRSERVDGFLCEAGPDTLLAQKPAGLALVRELGLESRLVPVNTEQRTLYVLHRGRLHALPDGMVLGVPTRLAPLVRTRLFSWPGKLRMAGDLVIPRGRPGADESIAAFFRRRLGREALDRLGGPFLAGIHAGDPERLSLPANFPALTALEARHGSLIRGLLASRPRSAGPPAPVFYSLRDGLGELVDALVARLPAHSLRLRCPVRDVRRSGAGFVLNTGGGTEVRARAVLLAVPAGRAAELLADTDSDLTAALAEVRFASSAAVYLGYRCADVAHTLDGHGLIVPEAENRHTSACSFVSTKVPGRAPEGHVLLRGFLGGMRHPESLDGPDENLVTRVHNEMAPVLGLRGFPVLTRVYRWPSATPQIEVGHRERVAALERRLATLPGLFLTGSGLRGTGIPDCVADARWAASLVA